MSSLDVHFHGERIGTLFLAGEDDYRLAYDPEVVQRVGPGATLLSAALPARPEPFGAEATRAYVEGLLPEGRRRERIAADLGVDPNDGWGLIAEIGRDCPGAVSFVPEGMEVAEDSGPEEGAWLSEEELEALVAPPRSRPSTASPPPRASLPGERHKLALVRDEEGDRWGLPGAERPSTHIVKPESGEYPGLAANEMFCTALASHAGLVAAHTEHAVIGGRPCTVSRRFDRARTGKGVSRLHQEDFCQALGFAPARDVAAGRAPERDAEGPRFAEACGLLTALSCGKDCLPALLGATVLNYALGNGDAHGKNFAVLYGGARPTLAPLYDLTSTAVYDLPTHTGMVLSSDYDETAYLVEMDRVGRECGVELDRFRALIADTAAKIESSLELVAEQAWEEEWHDPIVDDIIELATERARGLGYEVEY